LKPFSFLASLAFLKKISWFFSPFSKHPLDVLRPLLKKFQTLLLTEFWMTFLKVVVIYVPTLRKKEKRKTLN
jgi:hypothetical protein